MVCGQCGLVYSNTVLHTDMAYMMQSDVMMGGGDDDPFGVASCSNKKVHTTTHIANNNRLERLNLMTSGYKKDVLDETFEILQNVVPMNEHIYEIARSMVKAYYEINSICVKGDKKRMLLASACTLFAMRDVKEGALTKDDMCKRLALKTSEFFQMCNSLESTFMTRPGPFSHCFARDLRLEDVVPRMLRELPLDSDKERIVVRKALYTLHDQIKDLHAIRNMALSKQLSAVIYVVCHLLQKKKAIKPKITIEDVSSACGVSTSSLIDCKREIMAFMKTARNK